MDDILARLQQDIAERLRSDDELAGIAVVTERAGDITSEVQMALGLIGGTPDRKGIGLLVMQMEASPYSPELPYPQLMMQPTVRVIEEPAINNSGKTALQAARRVLRILHHWVPGGLCSNLVAESPAIIGVADPSISVVYDVQFRCLEADPQTFEKVPTPSVWPEDGTATEAKPIPVNISCDSGEAAVFYTTDGSPPSPTNKTAILYAGPFDVTEPCRVRAAAFVDGQIASDTAESLFT